MNELGDIDKNQMADSIARLPEAEKLVAALHWYEGLTLDEVGEVLGTAPERTAALHESAAAKVAATVGVPTHGKPLAGWSRVEVDVECARPWRQYDEAFAERYTRYFDGHPELRGEQRYSARDLTAALPPGHDELQALVEPGEWHRHHLSGKSSQTLAVGLLGVAARRDPSLSWLWEALAPLPPAGSPAPSIAFEQTLDAGVLGERPRQTAVDVLVDDPSTLICIEAKWREDGLGSCSCGKDGGGPIEGRCSVRVESRDAYWKAGAELLGLPPREPPGPCPISLPYQAVRNAAGAQALARPGQLPVFALIYDQSNPYFAGSGSWPGWPRVLAETFAANVDPQVFRFASVAWQALSALLPLDDNTVSWAQEKHGLAGPAERDARG